ncbi:MAG TPA: bifunctional methionine sulfoxide reductase B/A protein [Pirellulales bacterium]|jgi:peptide methionine sulfoxide reductase msrA/msrB|nr:bifunctional methionine sulfoxide reductase B/A protein [Pirellulales bacterium]
MKFVALIGGCLVLGLGMLLAHAQLAQPQAPAPKNTDSPKQATTVSSQAATPQAVPSQTAAAEAKPATVAVQVFNREGKLVGPVESPKVELSAGDWRKRLSPEAFDVLRNQGTEPPFSGEYVDTKTDGVYVCAGCGLPLFASDAKFHSGTGWPSFFQPIVKGNVAEMTDRSFDDVRTEIHCPRCGGHLGHVFNDGPKPTGLRYCLDSVALRFVAHDQLASLADPAAEKRGSARALQQSNATKTTATAVFAGGCFWATEAAFDQIKGVVHAECGYCGGAKETADYDTVCRGNTGHAESVRVTYDPSRVSYDQLLDVFFAAHNPTELNYQGNDEGPQYRSAIFYADAEQEAAAKAKIQTLSKAHAFPDPIVTAVEPLKTFFIAEKHHQNYVHDHPDESYIRNVSIPKVEHVRQKYPELIKASE